MFKLILLQTENEKKNNNTNNQRSFYYLFNIKHVCPFDYWLCVCVHLLSTYTALVLKSQPKLIQFIHLLLYSHPTLSLSSLCCACTLTCTATFIRRNVFPHLLDLLSVYFACLFLALTSNFIICLFIVILWLLLLICLLFQSYKFILFFYFSSAFLILFKMNKNYILITSHRMRHRHGKVDHLTLCSSCF